MRQTKIFQQLFFSLLLNRLRFLNCFENRQQILLNGQLAEDRSFLRKVRDAHSGALMHRQAGQIVLIQADFPLIRP